jgi:NADH-quinone oxidoreductase subunit L
LQSSSLTMTCIWVMGLVTAVMGTLIGRSCTDAKGILAYASLSQVGLIFVEIGLGFPTLALWHITGHAIVRTLQFLRAPSALHEFHQMHAAAGGHLEATGQHYHLLIPAPVQLWLYRLAMERGFLDSLLDRLITIPLRRMGEILLVTDSYITGMRPKSSPRHVLSGVSPHTVGTETKRSPGEVDA